MNGLADARSVAHLESSQRGVFSKADLQTLLAEKHPAAFVKRVKGLTNERVLRRFARGWYVTEAFDLATLSQRLAPGSYVSFGSVLARALWVGTNSPRQIVAVKQGRTRRYSALGCDIHHVGIDPSLSFGHVTVDGVHFADAEKALLDVLYFHLRGQRYAFDIYSDIRPRSLDHKRLRRYLAAYKNPRFVAFVEGYLHDRAAA